MATEQEFLRQLNLRNAAKEGSEEYAKHDERVQAYSHYPFFPLYMGDGKLPPVEAEGETIAELRDNARVERQNAVNANKEAAEAKAKKAK